MKLYLRCFFKRFYGKFEFYAFWITVLFIVLLQIESEVRPLNTITLYYIILYYE